MAFGLLLFFAVVVYGIIDPPTTPYMFSEGRRIGGVDQQWVDLEDVAPVMARSVVAAEDANYCLHWGFDMVEIRKALDSGGQRGASTISQQVVKNVYLWQGRSWFRKALEAVMTPMVEAVWTKRRIIEVYLNVAEFDTGVFGVEAAARKYFRVSPDALKRHGWRRCCRALRNARPATRRDLCKNARARLLMGLRQFLPMGGLTV